MFEFYDWVNALFTIWFYTLGLILGGITIAIIWSQIRYKE